MTGKEKNLQSICMIVAHPDDETLWSGGTILMHPEWDWEIDTLCRASDPDRSGQFYRVQSLYGAGGRMGDLDDGPEQKPLPDAEVHEAILKLTSRRRFNLVITHGPRGEYTRHRRHEEISSAVCQLWLQGEIRTDRMWLFAYSDGGGRYLPRPETGAHSKQNLPETVWQKKYRIITEFYGFSPESWEAKVTPRTEAFWCFDSLSRLMEWLGKKEKTG